MRADAGRPLKIWLLADVFPPRSGGSGWSAYYLGKALAERGHNVRVMLPVYDAGVARPTKKVAEYGGLQIEEITVPGEPDWAGRLGMGKALSGRNASVLMERRAHNLARRGEADVLHGQHSVSIVAASGAAASARSGGARVVSLGTVRDYWPLCPVSTRLFTDRQGRTFECRDCHRYSAYLGCARSQGRAVLFNWPLAAARWQRTLDASRRLAGCDAIVAVSGYLRGELARSGRVPNRRLVAIPNLVDIPSVDQALAGPWPLSNLSPDEPFLLFAGKLDLNKGPRMLPEALTASGVRLPVVLAGDGPLRERLEAEAKERGLDFRFHDWMGNEAVIRLMRQAAALLFPSAWQEPLSRVLLEGCAAGAAIVALNTGGTGDIIEHGVSGWLAADMASFVEGIGQVVGDDALNAQLRAGARRRAEEKFAAPTVGARVEGLYYGLLERAGRG